MHRRDRDAQLGGHFFVGVPEGYKREQPLLLLAQLPVSVLRPWRFQCPLLGSRPSMRLPRPDGKGRLETKRGKPLNGGTPPV